MKKYNLNSTWKYCVEMWDWIAKVWETPRYKHFPVWKLKEIWLKKHGFEAATQLQPPNVSWLMYIAQGLPTVDESRAENCFFCVYAGTDDDGCLNCWNCPGVLVDPDFDCYKLKYSFKDKPVEFAAEINRLNKIRKGEE